MRVSLIEKQSEEKHEARCRLPCWFGETEAAQNDWSIRQGEGSEQGQSKDWEEGNRGWAALVHHVRE